MGSPAEFNSPSVFDGGGGTASAMSNGSRHQSTQTRATFSGMTALASVAALLISVIATAVPHWGNFSPNTGWHNSGYGGSHSDLHDGNFGPFQTCSTIGYLQICGGQPGGFHTEVWIKIAGACSLLVVFALAGLAFFSVLHVAMQLQRREIFVSFQRAVFLKVMCASIAALGSLLACICGGIEFAVTGDGGNNYYQLSIGVCYYLQIILIFVNILFIVVCYISYKRAKSHPPHLVHRSSRYPHASSAVYDDHNANGVAMTLSSGRHGQPIQPIRPTYLPSTYQQYNNSNIPHLPQTTNGTTAYNFQDHTPVFQRPQPGPQQPQTILQGHSNNGFTPVSLVVPPSSNTSPLQIQVPTTGVAGVPIRPVPLIHSAINVDRGQPVKPIQPVQPQVQIRPPQVTNTVTSNGNGGHVVGVSINPSGRNVHANPGGGGHGGSMESLNSTLSSTLSFGSTTSTGSGVSKELRSSLKKPRNKDTASVSSRSSSSKQVRISLGQEQTQV